MLHCIPTINHYYNYSNCNALLSWVLLSCDQIISMRSIYCNNNNKRSKSSDAGYSEIVVLHLVEAVHRGQYTNTRSMWLTDWPQRKSVYKAKYYSIIRYKFVCRKLFNTIQYYEYCCIVVIYYCIPVRYWCVMVVYWSAFQ